MSEAPTMTMLALSGGRFRFVTAGDGRGEPAHVDVQRAPGGLWRVGGGEPVAYADAIAAILAALTRAGAVEAPGAAPGAHCLDIIEKAGGRRPAPASGRLSLQSRRSRGFRVRR